MIILGSALPVYYYLNQSRTSLETKKFLVYVDSQLENIQQRSAVRKTWKNLLPDDALFFFGLGIMLSLATVLCLYIGDFCLCILEEKYSCLFRISKISYTGLSERESFKKVL